MLAKWTPFPNPPASAFAPVLNTFEGLFKDPLLSELITAPWDAMSSLQMPHTDIVETQSQLAWAAASGAPKPPGPRW